MDPLALFVIHPWTLWATDAAAARFLTDKVGVCRTLEHGLHLGTQGFLFFYKPVALTQESFGEGE